MSTLGNDREFTRVNVAIYAELRIEGNVVFQGEIENVSFNGLLLRCETTFPEQTPCQVFLHLDGGQGGPSIEAKGLIRRSEPYLLAVEFVELIGSESVGHLRNLLLYNSGTQADQVEGEFESHVGMHPKS